MPRTRTELENLERAGLASYAQLSENTRGRLHDEEPPEWRTHFQRDRDRVIHSRAFRRLEYKTQVFLNGTGDHLRTRLTHTMEVAGISRNIARALKLNEDLTETIALAHDLGHSPFGHSGEEVLNELMKEEGGFEHNRQSLRIVDKLERKYPGFPGLNLTFETREGLMKHTLKASHPARTETFPAKVGSLEAQVANLADEIAYYSHDLDDGLESGLLSEEHLSANVEVWKNASQIIREGYGQLSDESRRYFTIRWIIDLQVKDVVRTAEQRISDAAVHSADDVRCQEAPLVTYSPETKRRNLELRQYLYQNLYFNPQVHEPNMRAVDMLRQLFTYFLEHPEDILEEFRRQNADTEWRRVVCDYLAGMTDRFVAKEFDRLIK